MSQLVFTIGLAGIAGGSVAGFIGKQLRKPKLENRGFGIFTLAFAAALLNLPQPDRAATVTAPAAVNDWQP